MRTVPSRFLATVIGMGLLVSGLATAAPAAAVPQGAGRGAPCVATPGQEYTRVESDSYGFHARRLQDALAYAGSQGANTIKVFRDGCLVGQGFRDDLTERIPTLNAGQTKTVVALIAGIVSDRGWIDLDAPVGRYFPADLGDRAHRKVTLRQFMQLTSGVAVNHVQGLNFFADQSRTREYFAMELRHKPGRYFEFDETTPSVVVDVLGRVIAAEQPGTDFQDFVQRELFDPLGIPASAWFWQRDRAGTTTGYSQLFLRPLEYGRLGELLRTGGTYGGRRVLSAAFVGAMRQGSTANCGFGLFVWLNSCRPGQSQVNTDYPSRRTHRGEPWIASAPSDMYYSLGLGTNTFVIPSLDMVITRSGEQEGDLVPGLERGDLHGFFPGNAGGPGDHEFFRLLMAAVTDMPASVRRSIANSGEYDREVDGDYSLTPAFEPPDAFAGSYLGIGPRAPVGCTVIACEGASNDGLRWLLDVPRVGPGVLGLESRPAGPQRARE
ncbi:MAG: serine hydrolase domain-containing protein [Sporichthyaceae bacterium]